MQATTESLHSELKMDKNHTKAYLLEEANLMFGGLDAYKKGDSDRSALLGLKGGSPWARMTLGRPDSSIPFTHLGITGYMQPGPFQAQTQGKPIDGLTNRFLTAFVPGVFDHLGKEVEFSLASVI